MVNHQAETTFGLSARDIGRLLRDLEVSFRPLELRTYLEQAKVDRRSARVQDVKWQRPGLDDGVVRGAYQSRWSTRDNGLVGMSVVFFDVTANRSLMDKVVQTNHQLEAAYEELQSTNEELETTNEELQSTVEELETTNEELQSTNEELETMNEELQSTNDELHTINDALRDRSVELDEARSFLNSVGELHPPGDGGGGPGDARRGVEPGLRGPVGTAIRRDDRARSDVTGHGTALGRHQTDDRSRPRRPGQHRRNRRRGGQSPRPTGPDPRGMHPVPVVGIGGRSDAADGGRALAASTRVGFFGGQSLRPPHAHAGPPRRGDIRRPADGHHRLVACPHRGLLVRGGGSSVRAAGIDMALCGRMVRLLGAFQRFVGTQLRTLDSLLGHRQAVSQIGSSFLQL